jgi:low affinity Fe/Cu permease
VFLIQNSQNRDGAAIQAKLDEVLIAVGKARSELVGIENLTDTELQALKAALEREALAPAVGDEGEVPTVEEVLKNRDQD